MFVYPAPLSLVASSYLALIVLLSLVATFTSTHTFLGSLATSIPGLLVKSVLISLAAFVSLSLQLLVFVSGELWCRKAGRDFFIAIRHFAARFTSI